MHGRSTAAGAQAPAPARGHGHRSRSVAGAGAGRGSGRVSACCLSSCGHQSETIPFHYCELLTSVQVHDDIRPEIHCNHINSAVSVCMKTKFK